MKIRNIVGVLACSNVWIRPFSVPSSMSTCSRNQTCMHPPEYIVDPVTMPYSALPYNAVAVPPNGCNLVW